MGRHERERGDRAAAAGEQVDRPRAERLDVAWTSAAWRVGEFSTRPSLRVLRPRPRGSYVTTVRSGKCDANAAKPLAVIGWPIISSGGRPSAGRRGPWTS
jgi:hypothetical protein